jgi:phospholipid/cholesterol/gamma-HCH transport system permease protein
MQVTLNAVGQWAAARGMLFVGIMLDTPLFGRSTGAVFRMFNAKTLVLRLQDLYLLSFRGVAGIVRRPFYWSDLIEHMSYAGAGSLPIVTVVGLFVGMALSLQIGAEFSILGLRMYTGQVVGISIISEIGPVMIAIIYAGRVGSGIASELGTMVMRHQVDTLRVFGVDPVKKLVTPRILGGLFVLPALTFIGDFVSLAGGAYIASFVGNQSPTLYWHAVHYALVARYVVPGVIKPFIFGICIACVACYMGFSTRGGAVGLKRSTTLAFVISTIVVIVADFFTTRVILKLMGY